MNLPFFQYICCINLDSRPDRWDGMQAQFNKVNITDAQRFSAVSFEKLQDNPPPAGFKAKIMAALQRKNEAQNAEHQIKAMWGCLSSHVAVIKHAKAQNWPYVLILEDDCEFEPYTNTVMQRVMEQVGDMDWDMLYLGGNQKKYGLRQRKSKNLVAVTGITLTHAYMIRASIYDKVINEAPQANMTIDDFYAKQLQNHVKTLIVEPPVAYQAPDEVSDISQVARRKKYNWKSLLRLSKRWLANLRYSTLTS
nr:glycosyltransferase family 25 protein [uncultured Methylotenera sp.]